MVSTTNPREVTRRSKANEKKALVQAFSKERLTSLRIRLLVLLLLVLLLVLVPLLLAVAVPVVVELAASRLGRLVVAPGRAWRARAVSIAIWEREER